MHVADFLKKNNDTYIINTSLWWLFGNTFLTLGYGVYLVIPLHLNVVSLELCGLFIAIYEFL